LPALRELIRAQPAGVFGCDFPFGLPREIVTEDAWEDFVDEFPRRYSTAEAFRSACLAAAGGRELRRRTDREARVPFCVYNLRLYRQTYHGIRDLLAPLVRDGAASVVPMQTAYPGRALLLEICPASTLKRRGLYRPYKGRAPARADHRSRIVDHFEQTGRLSFASDVLRGEIVADPGGDALDSVVAAMTAFELTHDQAELERQLDPMDAIEGRVYVSASSNASRVALGSAC
jgi:hypothetical protein